jgi:hypothetical protein
MRTLLTTRFIAEPRDYAVRRVMAREVLLDSSPNRSTGYRSAHHDQASYACGRDALSCR